MKEVGAFLNVDWSNYSADLSQALNSGSLETNVKIFEEMKERMQSACIKAIESAKK
jgi:hypothetical protein